MRICVVIPSEEHLRQAGVQIRYQRIEADLQELRHELEIVPIQCLARREALVHDLYIICKCYDARALLLAKLLAGSAKPVGDGLFDDYFSQVQDSRLRTYRGWLRELAKFADFTLCSTAKSGGLAAKIAPGLPVRIVKELPVPLDADALGAAVRRKLKSMHSTKTLHVTSFGVGENPSFSAGLSDPVAFGGEIARLPGRGFEVDLNIVTNRRAMPALRRLAVPVAEWTEEHEKAVLAKSLICFRPVNAQNFSIMKSLNRAVTTHCAGAQVLANGYLLCDPLSPFIYRDPLKLLKDIDGPHMALREGTVQDLVGMVQQLPAPRQQAEKLAEFLEQQQTLKSGGSTASPGQPLAAVIHGRDTLADVHKFAQWMGALSVSSPFCAQKLSFDLRFQFSADGKGLNCYIADTHCELLEAAVREAFSSHGKIGDRAYRKLHLQALSPRPARRGMALGRLNSPSAFTAAHSHVIKRGGLAREALFGNRLLPFRTHRIAMVGASSGQPQNEVQ